MAKEDLDLDVEAIAEVKKPGKMKFIIIAVVGLLITAGATLGALYFAGILGADDTAVVAESAEPGAAASATDAKAPVTPKAPLMYQNLEPPFIISFDGNASVRFMQLSIQVAARDTATIERVKTHTPAIRNGLLMLYSSLEPSVLNTRQGKEALLKDSLEEVNRVLKEQSGSAGVESAYFTNFVMQ